MNIPPAPLADIKNCTIYFLPIYSKFLGVLMKKIIKRDGSFQEFFPYKIRDAIKKAYMSENVDFDEKVFDNVMGAIVFKDKLSVEDIQDLIEKKLFEAGDFAVLKSFMIYRHTHKMQREHILGLEEDTTYINCT